MDDKSNHEKRFDGVGVSQGIAIASAYVRGDVFIEPDKYLIDSSEKDNEIKRLDHAINETKIQINHLKDQVRIATGSKKEEGIFDAHLLILEDRAVIDEVTNVISSQQEIEGSEQSKSANLDKPDKLPSPPVLEEPKNKYENKPQNLSANRFPERVRVSDEGENHTIIDADGRLIFDGSSSLGDDYQVVIFEDNVTVSHPGFVMNSDRLEARFKKTTVDSELQKKPLEEEQRQLGSGRLEIAEATGKWPHHCNMFDSLNDNI